MLWEYSIRVAGITRHQDCPSKGRVCVHGPEDIVDDSVFCTREPNNPADSRAVSVWVVAGGYNKHLGYLPKEIAWHLEDKDLPCQGKIVWIGEKDRFGVRVVI